MNQRRPYQLVITALFITCVVSCSQTNSRYSHRHDSAPVRLPTASELQDPIPRPEPPSPGGNKPYNVFGVDYTPMADAVDFIDEGYASWYGRKFHGHLTSNGEIYDMFSMSAAHKTLPLPTYVKVTNLANNKSVIVRVNDRGPFHGERIIDLSYSAAYKLDMLKTGTAKVRIEAITEIVPPSSSVQVASVSSSPQASKDAIERTLAQAESPLNLIPADTTGYHIQVFATRNPDVAASKGLGLSILLDVNKKIEQNGDLYKVQLGPFASRIIAEETLRQVRAQGYESAYLVKNSD